MPSGDSKSRAVRRRTELVAAMDTLSSHLQTTFVALSAALCQKNATDTSTNQNERVTSLNATTSRPPAQAHMAVVVGPNVGAAKAKVLLVFDGLEVKHWGVREDTQSVPDSGSVSDQEQDGSDDTDDIAQSSEEEDSADFSEEHEDSVGESMPESEEEYQDCIDYCNRPESPSSPPPHSRSPSPSPPMQIPTTLTRSSRLVPSSILSISTRIPSRTPSRDTSPVTSHEEIQKALTAADRLLSRTLASACAEDGGGLSCELGKPLFVHTEKPSTNVL